MTRLAVVTRVAAVIAVIAAFLAASGGASAASPVPAGFRAASFSATSARDWWLGGSVPCRLRRPCVALIRTLNGGRSFTRVHVPTLVDVGGNYDAAIRFANAQDGYLLGKRLWVTHDGGRRWRVVNLGGLVERVAVGGGFVYATVLKQSAGFLMRSPAGREDWTTLAEAANGFYGLSVAGGTVLIDENVGPGGEQRILISRDQGARFTTSQPLEEVACHPQEPASGTVWMLCSGGMADLLYRSTDGGLEFSQPDWNGNPKNPPTLILPNAARLGAATATTAVVGFQRLLRTTDGGRSFKRVAGMPLAAGWPYIGFFNAQDGVVLGEFGESAYPAGRLYYTSDAGASYHQVAIR